VEEIMGSERWQGGEAGGVRVSEAGGGDRGIKPVTRRWSRSGDVQRERERKNRCARGERFLFMNKIMLGIATVLPNALGSTVAIIGNI
jgi:hypothetical protein